MDVKHTILQTAFMLFLKFGFSEVSVNEIIREAKVTKGGFYHYFKSKDQLIEIVIMEFMNPYFSQPVHQMGHTTEWNNIREELYFCYTQIPKVPFYEQYEKLGAVDVRDFQFLLFEGLKKYPDLADLICQYTRKHQALLKEILEKGKRQGVIASQVDTEAYATTMTALRDGILTLYILDSSIDAKEKCDATFESIWNDMKAS